jgi:transcriptional regulator with XRE-family HTH domain
MQRVSATDRAKLAEAVGISVQAVGQVLNGASVAFTAASNAKAARYLACNAYWLATGEESPEIGDGLTEQEAELIRDFRALTGAGQEVVRNRLREVADMARRSDELMQSFGGTAAIFPDHKLGDGFKAPPPPAKKARAATKGEKR